MHLLGRRLVMKTLWKKDQIILLFYDNKKIQSLTSEVQPGS